MKVRHVLAARRGPVVTIAPDAPIREAVGILVDKGIGSLVILSSDGTVAGIITERDILRALAADDSILQQPVHHVMVREVIIGVPQDDLLAVAQTMLEKRVRHLPIVEDGQLIGIVSIGDVLKAQRDAYSGTVDTLETQLMAKGEK
jgi:CBS domain-containing protein